MTPEELLPQVYDELRQLAAAKLEREQQGDTLDATALGHEVWLKLAGGTIDWQDHTHFLRTAATAMRRILVDRARGKQTQKRSNSRVMVSLPELASPLLKHDVLAVDEALTRFAEIKPEHANLVEIRFYGGMTGDEAAAALGVSTATADRMWRYARAWLQVEMERE